jgi:acyl-homoserine lactone acylase PvdQ
MPAGRLLAAASVLAMIAALAAPPPSRTTRWRWGRRSRTAAPGPRWASSPANNSPESGTGTIYYTDGSAQSFTLDVGNFWYPSGQNGNPVNTQVAAVNYANYPTGSSGHTVYVFEQNVPLQAGKTVAAVTLPSLGGVAGYNAALHVFALAIG